MYNIRKRIMFAVGIFFTLANVSAVLANTGGTQYSAIACVAEGVAPSGNYVLDAGIACETGSSASSQNDANNQATINANKQCAKMLDNTGVFDVKSCAAGDSVNYSATVIIPNSGPTCAGAGAYYDGGANTRTLVATGDTSDQVSTTLENKINANNASLSQIVTRCFNGTTGTHDTAKSVDGSYKISHDIQGKQIIELLNIYPTMKNTSLYILASHTADNNVDVVVSNIVSSYVETAADKSTCLANMHKAKNGDLIGHPNTLPCSLKLKTKHIASGDVGYITVIPSLKGNAAHWNAESKILPVNLYRNYNDYLLYNPHTSTDK